MNTNSIESLLHTVKTVEALKPSETFRQNARIRILNQLDMGFVGTASRTKSIPYKVARLAASLATALLLSGTGVVYAAQESSPGSPLYPVKVASEQVALSLAPTKKLKTDIAVGIIDRRADEMKRLDVKGDEEHKKEAVARYEQAVSKAKANSRVDQDDVTEYVSQNDAFIESAKQSIEKNQEDTTDEKKLEWQQKESNELKPEKVERDLDEKKNDGRVLEIRRDQEEEIPNRGIKK